MSSESPKHPSVGELADEFLERYRRGERPALTEYVERYPEYADEIRDVFPGLAMIEELGPELPDTAAHPAAADLSVEQLGDFRIIREVGRGGMGVVYEAEQVSLGRRVALKLLPRQLWQDGRHARRFEREARAAARLHHTNIVPVFGVGEQDGLHYYVMQFIQGLSLDDVLDELKKLREESEADRAQDPEASVQGVDVDIAGAVRIRHEATGDVSALAVAQSLLSGRFERTLVLESSQSGQPSAVNDQNPALAPGLSTVALPETVVGRLSDTHVSASSFALPGQSETASRAQSRSIYWQSVARIGVQAADALDYAHDQGIVHRDVKPSNLLLDTRGTIWITDFGLAKAADQQDLTHTGDVLGTLRYMAPEQFDGRADARSDVYSLGLTLYELLALKPAFGETDRYRLVKQVTDGTPPRLRTLDPSIPRDLETIVHKAIDRDASHRYQSARELAEDLQRYLGDEPIRARRISPVARVRRWCRRNPAGATVAALLLIGLISSCAAAVVFLNQAERERELREAETLAKQQAEDALAEAERERARADENFAQAWSAVDRFYATVSQSRLLNVPGMQPLRRELLTDALDYYRNFIEQESGNPDLRKELADAQLGLARIARELGLPEQREAFRDALTLYRELSLEFPDDAEIQDGLATCYYWLGSNLQAIEIWDRLLERDPENAVYSQHLGDALNSLAYRQDEEQNYEAALVTHQRALYLRMELLRADPNDPQLHADLGSTLNNIGVLLARKERYEEALSMYRQSVAHDEFAFENDPGNILYGRFFAISGTNIAHLEERFGRSDEAELWFRRAAEVRARIASANPDVASLQSDAYDAWRLLAAHLKGHGQPEEAADAFRRAGDVLERLPQRTPDELFNLARVYALASTTGSQPEGAEDEPTPEQLAERRQLANRAVDALERAVDAGFSERDRLESDADLAALRGRPEYSELLARVETLSEFEVSRPTDVDATDDRDERLDEAAAQYSIGLLKTLFDEPDEALAALTRSAELREELLEGNPHDRALRTELAQTHRALADLAWRNDRYADARKHWEELFAVLEAAESGQLNQELAVACYDFGEALARSGMLDEALPYLSRRLELNSAGGLKPLRALYLAHREQGNDAAALDVAWLAVDRLTTDRQSPGTAATAVLLPLLLPEHLDEEQLNRLVTLAEQIRGRASGEAVWARRTLGLAAYRAGRFEDALEVLVTGDSDAAVQCGFVRAMALHRLERFEEAQRELEATLENHHHSEINAYKPAGSGVMRAAGWNMWFIADSLRKEAETLILGAPRPRRPMVMLHRARSYALLGNMDRANELFDAAVEAEPERGLIRVMRVRFLAEAGDLERARAEFAEARELFLATGPSAEFNVSHQWRQLGTTARLCGDRGAAAEAFAKSVELQSEVLRENPVDVGPRNALDGMYDDLIAELEELHRDEDPRTAQSQQRELYETLAINPLAAIGEHAAPYIWSVAVLPDGRRALSAGQDGNVCLWDLETGEEIRRYEHHGPVLKVACLPEGEQFLTAGYDTMIRLWDVESGEIVREFRGHTDHVNSLAVASDGTRVVSVGDDETLRVWDVATGELLQSVQTDGSMRCVAMSPDGQRALSGPFVAESYAVSLWDVETGEKLRDFAAHESTVYCVAFSPDGRRLVSGDQNGLVVLWDLASGDELVRWEENWGEARTATILDDGRILLGTGSGALAILDADSGRVVQRLDGSIRHYDLAILPNGRQVITGDADATVRLWSMPLLAPPDKAAELITRQFDTLAPAPEAQARFIDQIRNSVPVMDRLLELRPDEPQLKIARATAIADRGDWSTAAEALEPLLSELAPDALAQTGWWISGPHVGDNQREPWTFFPVADNLDPFQPVDAAEGSPWQLSWRSAGTGSGGRLTLLTETRENPIPEFSANYALRRIYATEASTPLYLFRADNAAHFWLNGKPLGVPLLALGTRCPVELALKPGWNTLLIKVINYAGDSWLDMNRVEEVDSLESRRLLVQAALLRGDWDRAMEHWQELITGAGGAADLSEWDSLTSVLGSTNDYEQRQKPLLQALAAYQSGDLITASQLYRDAVADNSNVFANNSRLASLRGYLEGLLDVEEELTAAIQQQPDSAARWRDRALYHLRRGEHAEAAADFQSAIDHTPPTIIEPGWTLSRTTILPGARAAHFSPYDGALYAGTSNAGPVDGIHRIDPDGTITRLCDADKVAGVVVEPDSGDVFFSEHWGGQIYRIAAGAGQRELWVSRFKPGDSDPWGMVIVPPMMGDRDEAGELLVVDSGWNGDDEIYAISTRDSQRFRLLHRDGPDVGPLVHALDVTAAADGIYLVDAGESNPGMIYRLERDGRLARVATQEEIQYPTAVAADSLTGDLLIVNHSRKAVLRVNPSTGAVSNCIGGLTLGNNLPGGLDISPDGTQLFITDPGAAAVFTFTRTPLGLAQQSVRPLLKEGRWDEAAEQLNAALDEETEPFVVQSDWWVTGPDPQLPRDQSPFPPTENLDPLQPVAGDQPDAVPPEWRIAEPDAKGRLDFNRLFAGSAVEYADSYALRRIYASQEQTVLYHFDADDLMRVWVNGQSTGVVESKDVPVQIPLQHGWNTLLVKVWNAYGNYFLAPKLVRREQVSPDEWNRLIHRAANVLDPRKVIEQLTADIAASPEDPDLLIQRGRRYLRVREYAEADADFAAAAALTPDELNKFLEAGWWVIGPYPAELREFCPPELDPDPSQPVRVIDPQTGLSDRPVAWQSVPTGEMGRIDLSSLVGGGQEASFYALAHVYSPDDRTATLRSDGNTPLMVWVNGTRCRTIGPAFSRLGLSRDYFFTPLTLREGRNTLLMKLTLSADTDASWIRLNDHPVEQAFDLARAGLTDEAGELLATRYTEAHVDDWWWLLSKYRFGFRHHPEMIHAITHDLFTHGYRNHGVVLGARLADCPVDRRVMNEFTHDASVRERLADPVWQMSVGQVYARLGQWDDVLGVTRDGAPEQAPLRAMGYHHLGQQEQARELLDRSITTLRRRMDEDADIALVTKAISRIYTATREACSLIFGDTKQVDEMYDQFQQIRQELWEARDPATEAFDDLVAIAADDPQVWLARGQRLAELGRFDEAAADFNQAVELAPDDVDVLVARARFEDERGNLSEASAAFQTALGLAESIKSTQPQAWEVVEREIGLQDAVLNEWQRQKDDARLWRVRAQRQIQLGQWKEAAESLEHGRHDSHELLLSILYCLLGDDDAWREACRDHAELLPDDYGERFRDYLRLYVLGLQPATDEELAELTQRMEARRLDPPGSRWERVPLGVALYRHGRYGEALRQFSEALSPQRKWQADARVWPLLAMTHWQLGHQDEARKWLERSAWWIDLATRDVDVRHAIGPDNIGYAEWLCAHLFYCEAAALIGAEPPVPEGTTTADYSEAAGVPATIRNMARVIVRMNAEAGAWDRAADWSLAIGQIDESIEYAAKALEAGSDEPLPEWRSSPLYQGLFEKLDNRDDVFDRLAALRPDDDQLWIERARWFAGRDEWERAAEHYEHAKAIEQGGNRQREYLCALVMSGRRDECDAFCRKLLENRSDESLNFSTCWGCALLPNPEIDQARLIDAMQEDPDYQGQPYHSAALAVANLGAGRPEQAILHAEEAANAPVYRAAAAFILALAHHRLEQFEQSREWYAEGMTALSVAPNPNSAILERIWAKLLHREALRKIEPAKYAGELNQLALEHYQSGTALQTTDQEAARGHFVSGLGLAGEVISALEGRTDLPVHLANAFFNHGIIQSRLDDDMAAKDDLARAVELAEKARSGERELTDDLRELLVDLSNQLATNDQWVLAAQTYEWLLEDNPTNFDVHRSVAFCAFLSNGPDAYREQCRTIVAQAAASDDVKAKRKAVSACILIPDALDDMTVLLDLAREVEAAAPVPPVFTRRILAGALFRAGRVDEAIPVLHAIEADETDPGRGNYLFLLAMAYHARGEEETATEWLLQGDLWTEQAKANGELERWERALKVQLWQQEAHQRLGVPLAGDDDPAMEAKAD